MSSGGSGLGQGPRRELMTSAVCSLNQSSEESGAEGGKDESIQIPYYEDLKE